MPAKRTPLAALAVALLLTACVTGQRPHFVDEVSTPGTPVGDPAVDAVLGRLEAPSTQPFTAEYTILTKQTGRTTDATVAVDVDRRSITVANIRFLIEGSRTGTCNTDRGRCSNTIDDGRISDIQVTHQFYGESAARRLRTDAGRRIDATVASTETITGLAATCVTIPLANGSAVYCVLDSGLLARMDNGDVAIDLTSFRDGVDETSFLAADV